MCKIGIEIAQSWKKKSKTYDGLYGASCGTELCLGSVNIGNFLCLSHILMWYCK
jgi:hypothetical protein